MKKVLHLITKETIFGECEGIEKDGTTWILVKNPWIAKDGNMMAYMYDTMTEGIGAVQVHPMNIIWSCDLTEFKQAHDLYIEKTTGIVTEARTKIII